MVRFLLLAWSTLIAVSMQAQPPAHTSHFSPFIDNNVNGFWEYLPRNYNTDVNTKYPLLIFIHGAGEQGSVQDETTINLVLRGGPPRLIRNGNFPDSFLVGNQWFKFIVISPQIKNGISGVTSTIQPSTIEAVIQYAITTYRVDANRIYLCGLSMGGGATWDYAGSSFDAARKLAGIIVAAGAGDLSAEEATNIAEADLPVLATHNINDNVIAASRTVANIDQLNTLSPAPLPKAVYWETGGHNVWGRTYENIIPGSSPNGNLADTLGVSAYEWLLQFFRPSLVLPVSWQSFTVRAKDGKALLQWTVSAQVNVKAYIVEKSRDGVQWTSISTIAPNGRQYSFTDAAPGAGVVYYRVKQVDIDNTFSYSAIKTFSADGLSKLLIYPNPFTRELRIDADFPATQVVISFTDLSGRTILTKKQQTSVGELVIKDLQGLSAGTYYLMIRDSNGNKLHSSKLVKN